MSLRIKILTALTVIFILLFSIISFILVNAISTRIEQLETDVVVKHTKRAVNTLRKYTLDLERVTTDYSSWDETVDFLENGGGDYIEKGLTVEDIRNLKVSLVLLFDSNNELIYKMYIDPVSGKELPFPLEVEQYFASGVLLVTNESDKHNHKGFIKTDVGPYLIVSNPISNTGEKGDVSGTFVFGQLYDQRTMASINKLLESQIDFLPLDDPKIPKQILNGDSELEVDIFDDDIIQGYVLIKDILGKPIYAIRITDQRTLNQAGQDTLRLLLSMLFIALLLMIGALFFVLDLLISRRLSNLSQEVGLIWTQGPDTKNVTVESADEISEVGKSINELLVRLRNNREEHRELELALDQATEATRLKNEFMSMMSHELRTPLNAIIGYTEIMLEELDEQPSDSEDKSMLGKIEFSSKHLLSLINEILDIVKIEAGHVQINHRFFDLHMLLENLEEQTKLLVAQKNVSFYLNIEPRVPKYLFGDEDHTHQILSNLLTNAVKFTTEGHVQLNVGWDGSSMLFVVEDTGIGIPENSLDDIFLLFRQADSSYNRGHDGSGLGLTITKKLVEVHNGEIEVESQEGIGTKFTVLLPFEGSGFKPKKGSAEF